MFPDLLLIDGGKGQLHAALAANVGGPLAVKPRTPSAERDEKTSDSYQLLTPVFTVKAALSAEESLSLHSGQRLSVSEGSAGS